MRVITAVDENGGIYYIPLSKATLMDNTSDIFTVFKHQITFDKKTYDIDESDFTSILSAMATSNDQFQPNTFVMIKLRELI